MHTKMGFVRIKMTGLNIEREVQKAISAGVVFKDGTREGYTVFTATVSPLDYKKLKKNLKHVKITRQYAGGAAIKLLSLRRRYGLVVGLVLVAAVLVWMSGRAFVFNLNGFDAVDQNMVLLTLHSEGLTVGSRVSGAQLDELEKLLLKQNERLQWISISQNGVVVNIMAKEKPEQSYIDYKTPGDLLAKKVALVEELIVLQGRGVAKKGQLVLTGDVLISGQLMYGEEQGEYVTAMGYCNAKVWYTQEETVPLTKEVRERTGRATTVSRIVLMDQAFGDTASPYAEYSEEVVRRPISGLGVPLYVEEVTYYEETVSTVSLTPEEALEDAKERLVENLLPTLPDGELMNITFSVTECEEGAIVSSCAVQMERIEIFSAQDSGNYG